MIKSTILLKRLRIDQKEFIASEELKRYCELLSLDYKKTIKYYVYRGYLIRIFKGIFYVKSLDEVKLASLNTTTWSL